MAHQSPATITTGQLVLASDMNQYWRDNDAYYLNGRQLTKLIYLKGSNSTFTNTTFASIDTTNLRLTVPPAPSGRLLVTVDLQAFTSANTHEFRLSIDGGTSFTGDATHGNLGTQATTGTPLTFHDTITVTPGVSHTIDLQNRVSAAATGTLINTSTPITMIAQEV